MIAGDALDAFAPAAGSRERDAWDSLDVAGRRVVAAWLSDGDCADALDAHPRRGVILTALGYSGGIHFDILRGSFR